MHYNKVIPYIDPTRNNVTKTLQLSTRKNSGLRKEEAGAENGKINLRTVNLNLRAP